MPGLELQFLAGLIGGVSPVKNAINLQQGYIDSNRDDSRRAGGHRSVTFYTHGVKLRDYREKTHKKPAGAGGKRGKIAGWSQASRRKMREFMITHSAPVGWQLLGGTFTLPPGVPAGSDELIFRLFGKYIQKAGYGMVWRKELQRRGALHWHCLIAAPETDIDKTVTDHFRGDGFNEFRCITASIIQRMWHDALSHYGYLTEAALKHSADVRGGGDDGRWLRYLQDHASKTKQHQIAVGRGRHWGIVGRAVFSRSDGDGSEIFCKDDLGDKQWAVFLRLMRRRFTPVVKDYRDPLGRRLGYSCRRGNWGSSVWFGNRSVLARMLLFAKGVYSCPEGGLKRFLSA